MLQLFGNNTYKNKLVNSFVYWNVNWSDELIINVRCSVRFSIEDYSECRSVYHSASPPCLRASSLYPPPQCSILFHLIERGERIFKSFLDRKWTGDYFFFDGTVNKTPCFEYSQFSFELRLLIKRKRTSPHHLTVARYVPFFLQDIP